VILKGAGAVALVALKDSVSLAPAFAAGHDKYPEDAFKRERSGRDQALYGKTAEPSDKVKTRRTGNRRERSVFRFSVSTRLPTSPPIAFLVSEKSK